MLTKYIEDILKATLQKIKPLEEDRQRLYKLFNKVRKDLELCLSTTDKRFEITLQGSFAKDTFIKEDVDIDIFVLFDPLDVSSEWIDKIFIPHIHNCLQNQYKLIIKYASHPYVTTYIDNIEINIVPAYNVKSPNNIITAVDRTPFHTKYILSKLNDALKDEIRILKYFLKTWNLYGAEINIQGFSGYLTELLILAYGTFLDLLKASKQWRPYKVCIDIEKHYKDVKDCLKAFKNNVLIVVDPIDPKRNAAAAVSLKTFSTFRLLASLFLEKPSHIFFDRLLKKDEVLHIEYINKYLKERLESTFSCLIGIEFEIVKPIPDIVWGQLNRIERVLKNTLKSHDFRDVYIDSWIDNEFKRAITLIEVINCNFDYEIKRGPPSFIIDEAINFIIKNKDALAGPWIDDNGILHCIKKRRHRPTNIVLSVIKNLQLSSLKFIRHIELINLLPLHDTEFRKWLKEFLERKIFKDIYELIGNSV